MYSIRPGGKRALGATYRYNGYRWLTALEKVWDKGRSFALAGRRCNWRVSQQKWSRSGENLAWDDAAVTVASDACAPVLWLKEAHDQLIEVQLARWLSRRPQFNSDYSTPRPPILCSTLKNGTKLSYFQLALNSTTLQTDSDEYWPLNTLDAAVAFLQVWRRLIPTRHGSRAGASLNEPPQ